MIDAKDKMKELIIDNRGNPGSGKTFDYIKLRSIITGKLEDILKKIGLNNSLPIIAIEIDDGSTNIEFGVSLRKTITGIINIHYLETFANTGDIQEGSKTSKRIGTA